MATISNSIIIGCWIIFLAYWFISARRVKMVMERKSELSSLAYRLPFITGAMLLWTSGLPHPLNLRLTPHTDLTPLLGAIICLCGLFVAIWARRTLAGNWSSNVTFKQGHELVKTGPYHFARHPIYTGMLLMCLATPVEFGWLRCWLGLLFLSIGLWIKLKQEEALMLQHFPDEYPAYQKQVKALVPFVI
ncbi:MAG: isoprenylcysteine carboxylmethyltransferase family protein [Verrucomicrobiota bacterium]|jgi:protein-S-isoprenylcysteine O-methyltransferase Ste14